MDDREKLMERYDDAAFALMMDEYAEAEGEAILAEFRAAAEAGELPEMPEELDKACRNTIRREYARRERRVRLRQLRRAAARVAVAVFVVIGILSTLVFSVEALRIPFMRFILEDHGEYSQLIPADNPADNVDPEDPFVAFLPEEYVKIMDDKDESRLIIAYQCNDDIAKLSGVYHITEAAEIRIDTENAVVSTIVVKEQECFLVEKEGYQLTWLDMEKNILFSFYVSGFDKETFLNQADIIVEWCNNYSCEVP